MPEQRQTYNQSLIRPLNWRQIRTLTGASIKSRYRNTFVGVIWVILSPLLMYSAQGYVFKLILKIEHENYALFLLSGLIPWIFLVSSVTMSTTMFVTQARLFKSFPIHPITSLLSVLLDNFVNFSLTFTTISIGLLLFGTDANLFHFLLTPIPVVFLFISTFSLAWLMACLQVFFHDVRFVMDFALSVLFFLTPIFYPKDLVPLQYRWVAEVNPIAAILAPIQALSKQELPNDYWQLILKSAAVSVLISVTAWQVWVRKKNDIYFKL